MQQKPPIIETKSLHKAYGNQIALTKINLTVNEGEIFGLLGHNGAGKTTTVSILTTLIPPTSGSATICGFDVVTGAMQVRQNIGYLPENVRLYEDMTAGENLLYFANLSGIVDPHEAVDRTLTFLDFSEAKHALLSTFSKGMRQRIGIAQAIMHDPKVLFLDEPTSGLDPMGVRSLREILIRLNLERGTTIFMNTHLLSEVAKTCTSIGVLNHGSLIYTDTLENTLKRFKDEDSLEDIYASVEAGA